MSLTSPYLGKPGAVRRLPKPQSFDGSPSRGESPHALAGGGVGITQRLNVKRSYSLGYDYLPSADADLIGGFYAGLFDDPVALDFVFVDSTVHNVLGPEAASCGARSQASIGWFNSVGSLARSTTLISPVAGSGVLAWTGATNSSVLLPGTTRTASVTAAPVYLPTEPVSGSVYLAADASYPVRVMLIGFDITGAMITGAVASTTITTSTSLVRAAVGIPARAPAFTNAVFVRLQIAAAVTGNPTPGTLYFAGAQLEYSPLLSPWQPGQGSPRVLITSSPGRTVQQAGYSDHTLTLGER